MKKLIILVGPPGSGKSRFAKDVIPDYVYINQDSQGKGHINIFNDAISRRWDVIVDRMNFSKAQRDIYLKPAKDAGYETEIVVIHESSETCLSRMASRTNHPTIKDQETALKVMNFFLSRYERVEDNEADHVTRVWPSQSKVRAIYCDLDGTLCDVEHRRHFVRGEGKKDWKSFFEGISLDPINEPVERVVKCMSHLIYPIVYCTGRSEQYRDVTTEWLSRHGLLNLDHGTYLFMRPRSDSRADFITKELLLDFEVLTRFDILFCLDDRDQVVDMLRRRGLTVFQVAKGDF